MKVLMQNRVDFEKTVAGDVIQLVKTKAYLERLGVKADWSDATEPDLGGYDLIHLFNIIPVEDTYRQFLNARGQQKPIVLSPIYWEPGEYLDASGQSDTFGVWWRQTMPWRREIMAGVKLILPNSVLELELLQREFENPPPAEIVPNAADSCFASLRSDRFRTGFGPRDFILSVGRICRRKNQLNLIKVTGKLGLPLVLIGPLNDGGYYQECRKAAAGAVVSFIDTLPPTELVSAYAAARVHALVSWYDTPGLVSLEAALAGCRIVSTDRGSAREYLGDAVFYCDPGDEKSIRQAVLAAWDSKPNPELKTRILQKYTWEQAALATYRGYRRVIG
jgi:glycosyltransferase involved in cell wall biosynthesis